MNLKRRKWWYDYTDTCKFSEKEIDDTVKPAAAVVDNSERWCYGLGLMRQGGEGQASHSYPLDPAWMQRSEVTWRTVCSIIAWLRQQWPPRVLRANWEHFIWIAYKNKLKEKKATFVAYMKVKLGKIWFNDIHSEYWMTQACSLPNRLKRLWLLQE